jgi:uncharacterized protein (TIGR03437 family)
VESRPGTFRATVPFCRLILEKTFNSRPDLTIDKRTQASDQKSSEGIAAVHKILERIQFMSKFSVSKISLAASAMLLCAGLAQAATPVTPLIASPTSVSLSYQLPGTPGAAVPVTLTIASGSGDAFVVDPTTVPAWLSISDTADVAVPASPGPAVQTNFVASSFAASLTAGVYSASVHVRVTGFPDLVIPVSLAVADVASTLSVTYNGTPKADNSTVALTWVYGSTPLPTATLNVLSSDSPVSFAVADTVSAPANTVNWIQLSNSSAIAYNYGTGITLNFLPDVLQNSKVGYTLAGQVTITYGSGPTVIHINVMIDVTEPNAALSANPLFPSSTPKHGSGSLTVVVTGSGFGTLAQGYTSATTVKIAYGAVALTNLTTIVSAAGNVHGAFTVVNPNTMILTIPWEDATPVSILNTVQDVTISITNGLGGETPVTATLHVTTDPIIYTITDGAALIAPASGVTPKFAPYEMITVFGDNFGPAAGTPVVNTLDSVSRYPSSVTTAGGAASVSFFKQDGTTLIANAPILFISNNQINAMVPSGVTGTGITGLQIVVTVGANSSAAFAGLPGAVSPGIFTTSSTGQGQGAILNLPSFTVNSSSNKAAPGSTVVLYVSGLGIPNSTSANTNSTSAAKFPSSCITVASYVTGEGITTPATADGAVLVSSVIATNKLPPCFTASPTVSIGGAAATVTYAGWVSGSVTGLYQINATVPAKATAGDLPVVVTMGGVSSQAGVTVAVN